MCILYNKTYSLVVITNVVFSLIEMWILKNDSSPATASNSSSWSQFVDLIFLC